MLPKPYESVRVKEFPRPCAGEEFYRVGKEGAKFLNPKALYAYYERHPELEDVYLKQDRMFRKREKELWDAVSGLEPLIKTLGKDAWLKFDQVLTAHNRCEERALRVMYVKGALDMADKMTGQRKGGGRCRRFGSMTHGRCSCLCRSLLKSCLLCSKRSGSAARKRIALSIIRGARESQQSFIRRHSPRSWA